MTRARCCVGPTDLSQRLEVVRRDVIAAVRELPLARRKRVMFEYVMIQGLTDTADEAHAVKAGYKDNEDLSIKRLNNTAIRKIHALMESQPKARLLLLTATPFQNHVNELIHLLSLNERHHSEEDTLAHLLRKGLHKMQAQVDAMTKGEGVDIDKVEALLGKYPEPIPPYTERDK